MCGVTGFYVSPGQVLDPASFRASLAALSHRGPDDRGIFENAEHRISLGHTRLSILDLSPQGHQPMVSADGRVVLVFNGEIYNFLELRSELEDAGHIFHGHSDTEVLLNLYLEYRRWGGDISSTLRRLNGIFAFALWDQDQARLLVVRDALGVKPLYFWAHDGRFALASEIKALLPLAKSLGGLDAASVHRYLSFLWCPGDGTPAVGVRKVAPGEAIWVKDGRIAERVQWYRLPAFRPRQSLLNKVDAITGTRNHLRRAVHSQLVADVPVGAFLSGGLDSSSVVAFAREQDPNIRCFTIESTGGGDDGMVDDLAYAKRVAQHLNVPLEVVRIDAARMARDLEAMVAHLDEPLADPAPLNVLYISRIARDCGIKVLLSGCGGDDLFTGYRRHRALATEQWWNWIPRPALAALDRLSQGLDSRRALGRRLKKLLTGAALKGDARLVNYFLWTRREDLLSLYTPAFRAALGEAAAETPMLDFLAELPKTLGSIDRMLALEQRFFLADHNLTYSDKMSMAASVEVRVPFLDLELVEFANRVPDRFKQHRAEGKWVLKKAMEPYLPRDVIYRPKSGFGAPLRRWMRSDLRELLSDVLGEGSLSRRGIFSPVAVQRLIADNDAGKVDASYTLLSLLCIELWCRRFIDNSHATVRGVLT